MYRRMDRSMFMILGMLAHLSILASLLLITVYHFLAPDPIFRYMAIVSLVISVSLHVQMFLSKMYVLEIRVANFMTTGNRPSKMTLASGNAALVIYSVFFWLAVIGVILSMLPQGWEIGFLGTAGR